MRNLEDQSGDGMSNEEIVAHWYETKRQYDATHTPAKPDADGRIPTYELAPYQLGFIAFVEGKKIHADPYAASDYTNREWWQMGYMAAQKRQHTKVTV